MSNPNRRALLTGAGGLVAVGVAGSAAEGLFISKTPCVGDMNPLIRLALPAMRAIGKAPHAGVFRAADLSQLICAAGFDILANESHATKGNDNRPYIVARKR